MNHRFVDLAAVWLLVAVSGCTARSQPDTGSATMSSSTEPVVDPSTAKPDPDSEVKRKALKLVGHFAEGKFADAVAMFDAPMAKAFTKEQAEATWKQLIQQLGAYKSAEIGKIEQKDAFVRATVSTEFDSAKVNLIVVFESGGQVTGFFVKPQTAESPWAPPGYAKSDSFTEEEVVVGDGEWALPGTLTLPKAAGAAKLPAIVLVHGSGPNDRDETIGASKPFKDLAWGLASRGVAVLRYDKVTKTHGARFVAKWGDDITLARETIDDALKAVALLRKDPRIDSKKIVYLGHSQGALAAPRAGKLDPTMAGLIIMAAPTRPLEEVALTQIEYLSTMAGANGEGAKQLLPAMREAVKLVKSPTLDPKTPTETLPLGIPAPFWLDMRGYKPDQMAASLKMPVLVLQGEADYQVNMVDFAGWKKSVGSKANAKLKSYPGLLHSFIDCGCKLAKPDDYAKPGNVALDVIDDIEKWVKAREGG